MGRWTRTIAVLATLLVLLGAAWPAAVQGQGPQPEGEVDRFRELRAREPGAVPRHPEVSPQYVEPEPGASPSALADWSRLAYAGYIVEVSGNYEIYVARGDGTSPARLTYHNAVDSRPELDRGCSRIAFDSRRDGNYEIYRMNADGSAQTRLTYFPNNDYFPTWSPDGSKIAFFGYPDSPSNAEVYVMNADGSGQTRLTWDPAWDGHPTWSPDGSKIAFISDRSGPNQYELWTMNADGSNPQRLSYGLQYGAFPEWSPDGSRIAVNDDYNGDGWFDLAIINVDGTNLTHPLGASPGYFDYLAPTWSPDGNHVAYARIQYIYYQGQWYWMYAYIYGLNLLTNQTYLLTFASLEWWPDWETTDTLAPASEVLPLPAYSGTDFDVFWQGSDEGDAALRSYDVQYRDGEGPWTDWFLDTTETQALFSGADGHTYHFRSRARDYSFNVEPYPDIPDASTLVDVSPPSSVASSPRYTTDPSFTVTWSGSDAGAGIASYDVQVRDGGGPWVDWLSGTTDTSAVFSGQVGHTYYFQCRARDNADNLEAYPGGAGDTQTQVLQYALSGYVLGNREQAVAAAAVEADPPAANVAQSGADGAFVLYLDISGTYTLTVTRDGYGPMAPMYGVSVPGASPTFYLPPLDDRVEDGGFEAGDLAAWSPTGAIGPVLTATAHTGDYAVALGGSAPGPVVTPTEAFSVSAVVTAAGGELSTTVALLEVPAGAVSGTVVITMSGVPTVTGLPTGTQDVGVHVAWVAALTDGTALTETLTGLTLTVFYEDAAWQAAQVSGEETLGLWRYDAVSATWAAVSGTVDVLSNTVVVTTAQPGLYALLGAPLSGPWGSVLWQELVLTPTVSSGTLSLLYRVEGAEAASDTLRVVLAGVTETVSYTLPLTVTGWRHVWWEVPGWAGPTLTLRLEWEQAVRERPTVVILDEISLGSAVVGSYPIYLPLVVRGY